MEMATRSELKQSQRISEIADAPPLLSNLTSTGTENEIRVRSKRSSSHNRRKERVNEHKDDDELVKYMSKLPGYLEKGESNVLNVGVLDWGRLEKWKHGRERDCGSSERKVSRYATASTSGVLPNDSHRCKIDDDQVCIFTNLSKGKASRDIQHSVHGVRCTLEPEFASRDSLNKQEDVATCSYKSSGRDHHPGKSRRSASYRESTTSGLLSEMGNSGGNLRLQGKETRKREGMIHGQEARERGTESGREFVEEKIIGDLEEDQVGNIVLLRSRKESRSNLSGEPQVSVDDYMRRVAKEVTRSLDLSDGISISLELSSQIPRSCPLSIDLERDSQDMMLLHGKKERFGGRSSRVFDEQVPEDESRKSRHFSPSKRFSFSFVRLSKSFSSKEDSADNIIKSDSMRFDGSAEKQNVQCGSRVSPLRRLLLKSKGSENVLPSKARSSSKLTNVDEKKPHDTSRTRALFQLTIRNGIPLFQFVVDDDNNKNKKSSSRSILGATMKSSASSFKDDDTVQYCTFYSVQEAKKKKSGSWLHKEKQGGFVYNVIGQMRLKKSGNIFSPVMTESVLFDGSEQVTERKEVAAVVIKKNPVEETSVIIPGGVHSLPEKGAPSPLISRWRSGGKCDCGGWDVGCKLHVLSNKTLVNEFDQSFKLYDQEGSEEDDDSGGPALEMTELKRGICRVEFSSFLSHLQAFFVCVTVITCASEDETVSTTTGKGKSSSPFAPPLSPVGRV